MGEFSSMRYAKEVCYVKLTGEFSQAVYTVKVLLNYDKGMGEFSSTMYTVNLLCSSHG